MSHIHTHVHLSVVPCAAAAPVINLTHHMQYPHTYVHMCVYYVCTHRDHGTCMLLYRVCWTVADPTASRPLSQVVPYVQPPTRWARGVSASVGIENAESTPVHEVILRQHSDEELTEKVCGDNQQLRIK